VEVAVTKMWIGQFDYTIGLLAFKKIYYLLFSLKKTIIIPIIILFQNISNIQTSVIFRHLGHYKSFALNSIYSEGENLDSRIFCQTSVIPV